MKGIVLSGGAGTRLFPATKVVSKQLLPVYDKPMIYYPISLLMMAGIREILIITAPESLDQFQNLLGTGAQWGLKFSYLIQPRPEGIAQALILGRNFIQDDSVTLILGDNIFWGEGLAEMVSHAIRQKQGATIFLYRVHDPERYGVATIDQQGKILEIEEKPKKPKSNFAVTGLYCYDYHAAEYASMLKPSGRGELEITELNRIYLQKGELRAEYIGRGVAWLDTGTHQALLQAAMFVESIQERQGLLIAAPEEIAYRMGYISTKQLLEQAQMMRNTNYGNILIHIAQG